MMDENKLIQRLADARIELEAALAECKTAQSVFYDPPHSAAKSRARVHLSTTLSFLAKSRIFAPSTSITSIPVVCSLENAQPILDNPFYNYALAKLELGNLLLLENDFPGAVNEFSDAAVVFPFSSRVFLALGNAMRCCGGPCDSVEDVLRKAIDVAEFYQNERSEYSKRSKTQRIRQPIIENDSDNDSEQEEQEENDDWLYTDNVTAEVTAGTITAKNALILLFLQQNRITEAAPLLASLGYKFRLSSAVLAYSIPPSLTTPPTTAPVPFVKAIDNALPQDALDHLRNCFARDSVFWREHFYCPDTPYFSYTHPLKEGEGVKQEWNAMDQIIKFVYGKAVLLFPEVRKAKAAEWWVHSRGPTLVTNQRLGDPLADKGWLVVAKVNRLVCFDGSVLHGVVPGRGECEEGCDGRRTSFMVAFWENIDLNPSPENIPGSARPFPYTIKNGITWPKNHALRSPESWPGIGAVSIEQLDHVAPIRLNTIWEEIVYNAAASNRTVAIATKDEVDCSGRINTERGNVEEEMEYSKSELGLPNYNLVFQGF
ncbi:hypothetical protein HK100_008753 [Physocladia obscura]|uniref:Uncharacterized protein n=1 Tax=Physocladia obscura TaxID=109957 RepID=A0AAD5T404_9FUNG|nr:hypothetical protein HK100_008753 [Physocladia obscura]